MVNYLSDAMAEWLVMAAYHHEEITASRGRELLRLDSIQGFRHYYHIWLETNDPGL